MKPLANPAISVIIPTYNRAQWLRGAITSVLNQTYQDYEIIVVNDGSTDDSQEVVNNIKDSRIRYMLHERNRGASASRNTGIHAAKGDYVAFLDDDDEWLPEKLEKQLDKFNSSSADIGVIYAGSSIVSARTGRTIHSFTYHSADHKDLDFLWEMTFTTSVPLIKKSCFRRVGLFDETLPAAQDRDMWIRLAGHYAFDCVPEILVRRYLHGDQITSRLKIKIEAKQQIIQKYQDVLSKHPQIIAHHFWRLGVLYCIDSQSAEGRSCFWQAIQRMPSKPELYKHLLLSFIAPRIHRRSLLKYDVQNVDGIPLYY